MFTGKFKWVRISDIIVKPPAQRYRTEGSIRKLRTQWNIEAFCPLVVYPRGRRYVDIDGQGRLITFKRLYPEYVGTVPCWVLPSRSVARGALLFLTMQSGVTPITVADRYHVGLTAGVPEVVTTDAVLRRAGIKPIYGKCRPGKNETRCGYAFARACEHLGEQGLREVVRCVRACRLADKSIDPEALKATFIEGVEEYVRQGGKAGSRGDVANVLKRAGQISGANGRKRAGAVAEVLKRTWSRKKR